MTMQQKSRKNWWKVLAFLSLVSLALSILPILRLSFYDRATGDDYGYGAVVRQTYLATHSLWACAVAAVNQSRSFWHSWQGTWFSTFLFAFQPESFNLNAYWITPWLSLALLIPSVFVFFRTVLVRVLKFPKEHWIILSSFACILMTQFVYSPRSALFWFNGVAHYIVPLALALYSISCAILWFDTRHVRYVVIASILMTLLGGMSYPAAILAILTVLLLWILNAGRGRYIFAFAIPLFLEIAGLLVSVLAPGNAVRGGEGYSVTAGRIIGCIGEAIVQGTKDLPQDVLSEPLAFLILVCLIPVTMDGARKGKEAGADFHSPWLVIPWLYLTYCAMYWPGIFSGVEVSGGIPNTIWQVLVLTLILAFAYLFGALAKRPAGVPGRVIWAVLFLLMCAVTFRGRSTVKETVDYRTYEYIASGQADDYREQMEEFYQIMTDPSVTDAVVHASNDQQGPLMHMPITEDPTNFTNDAAARFFGKNSVVAQ